MTPLDRLKALGWKLNNLFEHDNGTWQCNARREATQPDGLVVQWTEWSRGATADEALAACVALVEQRTKRAVRDLL